MTFLALLVAWAFLSFVACWVLDVLRASFWASRASVRTTAGRSVRGGRRYIL